MSCTQILAKIGSARVGILSRCAVGYVAVFLFLGASNFYAVLKLHHLSAAEIPRLNGDIRVLEHRKMLVDAIFSEMRFERKFLLTGDPRLHNQFLEANKEFHRYLSDGRWSAGDGSSKNLFDAIEADHGRYERLVHEEAALRKQGRLYEDEEQRLEKDRASDAILENLRNLENCAREDARTAGATVNVAAVSSLRMTAASSVAGVLCALLASVLITRSVTRPLGRLVNKTREVAAGVFKGDLRIDSPPEVSRLAGAFNCMCEKLTEVDRMKNDFLSIVSHDLRTPLTTIKEGTSLLLEGVCGEVTEKQERLLAILSTETARLIQMVSSILDLSKMEAGMMAYSLGREALQPLIDQASTEVAPLAEAKKIVFEKRVAEDLPPPMIDRERILQALRNLIGNAVKFTPENGRVRLAARVWRAPWKFP